MQLTKGKRYAATIDLGLLSIADNEDVRTKLLETGFVDVTVSGTGRMRNAVGTWASATVEIGTLPSQIVQVTEVIDPRYPLHAPTGGDTGSEVQTDSIAVLFFGPFAAALLLWYFFLRGKK